MQRLNLTETTTNKKATVLLVEDKPDELRLASFQLTDAGLEVHTAQTAGQVINMLDARCKSEIDCFNLIVLDVDLPDVTGTTLGEFIRAKYKTIPIIFYTGYGRLPHIVETAKNINAILLTKPIDGEEFVNICKEAIAKRIPERAKSLEVPQTFITHILRVARNPKIQF